MIDELKIKNFQSHKESELKFDPGVNIIVGSSDSGKSAIFRSLIWVLTNRPLGNAYMRWNTKQTSVNLNIDGQDIERYKTASKNLYKINGSEFIAGQEVPEEVTKILKMSSINIHPQIGKLFLLESSPGEVAQFFNDIAGLSDIDISMKNLQSDLRKYSRDLETYKNREKELKEELQEYDYINDMEMDLQQVEKKQELVAEIKEQKERLNKIYDTIMNYRIKLTELEIKEQALPKINETEQIINEYTKINEQINRLSKLIQDIQECNSKIEELQVQEQALPKINEVQKKEDEIEKIKQNIKALKKLLDSIQSRRQKAKKAEERYKKIDKELHAKMPDICPLCGAEKKQ